MKMGVVDSIRAIRFKYSWTVESQENLANRIGFTLRIENAAICDLRFGALHKVQGGPNSSRGHLKIVCRCESSHEKSLFGVDTLFQ